MSIALERFYVMVLSAKPAAIELLVWMGVGGCGWPSSMRLLRKGRMARTIPRLIFMEGSFFLLVHFSKQLYANKYLFVT
jgi:hypothetical protein